MIEGTGEMYPESGLDALVFDLGGVMIEIDSERAFRQWAELSSLSVEQLRRRFRIDEPYRRHERGEIDCAEYFSHLRELLDLRGTDAQIAEGWNAILAAGIGESLANVRKARQRLPCYMFSNSNPTHRRVWEAKFPEVVAVFDRVFVSSDLGLRKPERAAYESVAGLVGAPPSRLLFFDDTPENVEGARSAGLQAILVRSPKDITHALSSRGIV